MVAGAAVPLSLAIAMGSQVEPGRGLISAVVAGTICALFGGTRLSVSGPANSMLVMMAVIVEKAGTNGLLFVGFMCGLIQLFSGFLGFEKLVRYIPLPLVAGFTAGIGVIIFVSQLPRALGLPVPPGVDVLNVVTHLGEFLHDSKPIVVLLSLITILIYQLLRRFYPKLPASLFAVVVPSLLVNFAGWEVPRLGPLLEGPVSFGLPNVPSLPVAELFEMSLLLFALASLETRLCSSAMDRLIPGEKHDGDQEMIGQGLGNCFAALFGGMPASGVIARSTLNIKAGAQTRRAALLHALFVGLSFLFLGHLLPQIPIAALSGVLLSIALTMILPKEIIKMWRSSPLESLIYWITFFTIVAVDLMAGVQLGIFAALLIALWNLGQARLIFHKSDSEEVLRVAFSGNLTFMSSRNMELLSKRVERLERVKSVIADMAEVRMLDSTGAAMLIEFVKEMKEKGVKVIIKSLNRESREMLAAVDSDGVTKEYHATSESEVAFRLKDKKVYTPRDRLLSGVERYREERKKVYEELFDQLGQQQKPHTLFVTCSDSRINPSLITSSEPGELFIVRNVGNMIPPLGADDTPAEGAAVEFSLGALGVEEIIICGHTRCGAIKGVFQGLDAQAFPSVCKWVEPIATERAKYPQITDPEDFVKVHVLEQARNILSYPIVRKKISEGQVRIHCWIYDVVAGEFLEWTGSGTDFELVGPNSLHGNIQALLSPTQSNY